MVGTYIENYERNLIENAFNEGYKEGIKEVENDVAMKMKADGISSEFIFKYCGIWV